jgi:hypothetical protein
MRTPSQELTLSDALSDPLVRAVMAADNVDPAKLESMLRRIAEEVAPNLSRPTEAGHGCGANVVVSPHDTESSAPSSPTR